MSTISSQNTRRVEAVRSFNRFYTNTIGVLHEGLHDTRHSLTEARVLFELGRRHDVEVAELRAQLDIDAGYLSRLLSGFEAGGLLTKRRAAADGRRQVIALTEQGRSAAEMLDARSEAQIEQLLAPLPELDQSRLVGAMETIRGLLDDAAAAPHSFVLRPLGPGDLGWVVQSHGALYAAEYGFDETFEALVARIVAEYAENRDARREAAWIAEVAGEPVGCVFCVAEDVGVAKLRLLLVDPRARGMGVGARLVEECVRFARGAGYERMTLWTNDVLTQARRLYERAGFRLVEQEEHHSFGHDLVGQNWVLTLDENQAVWA